MNVLLPGYLIFAADTEQIQRKASKSHAIRLMSSIVLATAKVRFLLLSDNRKGIKSMVEANFSLFTFTFYLFFVPLQLEI